MLKHLLGGLIVAAALAGSAVAGPLEDANAAYDRGDYTTALRVYQSLAEQGLAQAQYALGFMYDTARACRRIMPRR